MQQGCSSRGGMPGLAGLQATTSSGWWGSRGSRAAAGTTRRHTTGTPPAQALRSCCRARQAKWRAAPARLSGELSGRAPRVPLVWRYPAAAVLHRVLSLNPPPPTPYPPRRGCRYPTAVWSPTKRASAGKLLVDAAAGGQPAAPAPERPAGPLIPCITPDRIQCRCQRLPPHDLEGSIAERPPPPCPLSSCPAGVRSKRSTQEDWAPQVPRAWLKANGTVSRQWPHFSARLSAQEQPSSDFRSAAALLSPACHCQPPCCCASPSAQPCHKRAAVRWRLPRALRPAPGQRLPLPAPQPQGHYGRSRYSRQPWPGPPPGPQQARHC
jgi:hypothetical protein